MSLTKVKLAEWVVDQVNGGTPAPETPVEERDVYIFIEPAINSLIAIHGERTGIENIDGDFIATYNYVAISEDIARKEWYSTLPAKTLNLNNDRAIIQVSPMKNQAESFPIIKATSKSIFKGLEADSLLGKIGVYSEKGRIYYSENPAPVNKVLMKLLISITELGDDDLIPIPSAMEIELVKLVVEYMTGKKQIPEDKLNDSSDNI